MISGTIHNTCLGIQSFEVSLGNSDWKQSIHRVAFIQFIFFSPSLFPRNQNTLFFDPQKALQRLYKWQVIWSATKMLQYLKWETILIKCQQGRSAQQRPDKNLWVSRFFCSECEEPCGSGFVGGFYKKTPSNVFGAHTFLSKLKVEINYPSIHLVDRVFYLSCPNFFLVI